MKILKLQEHINMKDDNFSYSFSWYSNNKTRKNFTFNKKENLIYGNNGTGKSTMFSNLNSIFQTLNNYNFYTLDYLTKYIKRRSN